MKAREIMVSEVRSIYRKASLKDAVLMLKRSFGDKSCINAADGLVVVNENGELAGIVTPLTLMTALIEGAGKNDESGRTRAQSLDPVCERIGSRLVEEVMERQPISVTEDASLLDVAELFVKYGFQRVPVVHENRVLGMIYRSPLLFYMTRSFFK